MKKYLMFVVHISIDLLFLIWISFMIQAMFVDPSSLHYKIFMGLLLSVDILLVISMFKNSFKILKCRREIEKLDKKILDLANKFLKK